MSKDYLRHVRLDRTGYKLLTWDTHRRDKDHKTIIGYRFISPKGTVIFENEDFAGSPMHGDDSDDTLRNLLGFLTLRPGDTEGEYFDSYTNLQRKFAASADCEALQEFGFSAADLGAGYAPPALIDLPLPS